MKLFLSGEANTCRGAAADFSLPPPISVRHHVSVRCVWCLVGWLPGDSCQRYTGTATRWFNTQQSAFTQVYFSRLQIGFFPNFTRITVKLYKLNVNIKIKAYYGFYSFICKIDISSLNMCWFSYHTNSYSSTLITVRSIILVLLW